MKRKAQEEMVGFALIIVIVSVILLVFLGFFLRNPKNVEIKSYEVENFIQSVLQTTSTCEDAREFLSVQDLIFIYEDDETCLNGDSAQEILVSTLNAISEKSWNVGENAPIKGYELKIVSEDSELFLLNEGNLTKNYRGASQPFTKGRKDYDITFNLYYD